MRITKELKEKAYQTLFEVLDYENGNVAFSTRYACNTLVSRGIIKEPDSRAMETTRRVLHWLRNDGKVTNGTTRWKLLPVNQEQNDADNESV